MGSTHHILIAAHRPLYVNSLSLVPGWGSSLQQLGEVGRTQSTDRVPSRSSIPARVRDDRATVRLAVEPGMAIAPGASTKDNVVQGVRVGVKERVQEAQGRLVGPEPSVVEKSNNTSPGRS